MAKLAHPCPVCTKPLELVSEETFLGEILQEFKCGHSFAKGTLAKTAPNALDFFSVDGSKVARDYQKTGVEFIMDSEFSCVIGDQMRLGKTPQSLLALKNAFQKGIKKQALILVRAANLWQWVRETHTWVSELPNSVWVCQGTKSWIPPGFQIYIMSMDTFGRKGVSDALLNFGFDVVVVDEAHSFKNTSSQRSQALTAFLRNIERSELEQTFEFTCPMCKAKGIETKWEATATIQVDPEKAEQRVFKTSHCPACFAQVTQQAVAHVKVTRKCGIVMLTGTAIKNKADEYFVPLNLVAPEKFPSIDRFRRQWLEQDPQKGTWSRINRYRFQEFKAAIAPYVLRREKEDVYTDLPALNRIFTVIEIQDEKLKKAYNQVLDKLELANAGRTNWRFFDSIGELQQLRQICGLAKVNWIADYANDLLADSDKQKLAIGIHHHSVRDSIAVQLRDLGVVKLSGEDSAISKDRIMRSFETSPDKVLIINMLAGGVGMDFHYCDYALIAERQWSSADEEQFEFRFYNPDLSIKTRPTNIEYVLGKGTIDQFFYEMVEEKRKIFGETLSNNWSLDQDTGSFSELMERTVASRL